MRKMILLSVLLTSALSFAYRDSDIDNLKECEWNKAALTDFKIEVLCNDLYHLYQAENVKKSKRPPSIKLGAFNVLGDGRFKDYGLIANILKGFDVVAVSEVRHSTGREMESNINLAKHKDLNFKKHYHRPGYLKLLLSLRKLNPSWSLILSPVGQSENEELLGFYYRSDRAQLDNSEYCKTYNRGIREKGDLIFSGGHLGPKFKRKALSPYLNKSYACLLDIDKDENDFFRIPFTARFKIGTGFDFQMLSYHARFQSPISTGSSCGFQCLKKINAYLNDTFHKEGAFLQTLDYTALRFLKKHLDFLTLTKDKSYALNDDYGAVIKFKYDKPSVYKFLMEARDYLKEELAGQADVVWADKYKGKITRAEKTKIVRNMVKLFSDLEDFDDFKSFISEKGKDYKAFLKDIVNSGVFKETYTRYSIWTSPEKIARFNELSLALEEMDKIATMEKDADVVLGGDLNLEDGKNKYFWNYFTQKYRYSNVAIGSRTSISDTSGLKSAYDHFMYDGENSLEECHPVEATVLDFVNDKSYWNGFEEYFVKSKSDIDKLSKREQKKFEALEYVDSKGKLISAKDINMPQGYTSCWDDITYKPASLAETMKNRYECKILNRSLTKEQAFRYITELVSDHLPISMKCSKISDID